MRILLSLDTIFLQSHDIEKYMCLKLFIMKNQLHSLQQHASNKKSQPISLEVLETARSISEFSSSKPMLYQNFGVFPFERRFIEILVAKEAARQSLTL